MSEVVQETSPLLAELVGLFFISILVSGLVVGTDIVFHDQYVGLDIRICTPDNQELLCMEHRKQKGLPDDAQIEIGKPYWELLAIQAIVIPLGFGIFRFITIAIRKRKFTGLRVFIILLWFLVPFALFMFGIIDVFYYVGRGLEIPPTLNWLNEVGIFDYTKVLGQDPLNVERGDLIFTFTLGILFIIGLFFIAIVMYQNSRLKGFV